MTNIIEKPKTNTLIEEYRQQALAYGHEKQSAPSPPPCSKHGRKPAKDTPTKTRNSKGSRTSCPKYSTSGMRQSPPPSTHDSRSGPSSISRRKPTRHTIRGFFPKHLPTGSPTPTSNPTTTGYTMPSQPHAVSPTLPRRRSTAPIPLPSPPISHGGGGKMEQAYSYAILALDADRTTSLAALVLVALSKGKKPAYLN